MGTLTTQQHYELAGGTLKVTLVTDHALSAAEREGLAHIADACEGLRAGHARPPGGEDAAAAVDEAIWELGGEQDIVAG